MVQLKFTIILVAGLIAYAQSAPTETESATVAAAASTATTTITPESSTAPLSSESTPQTSTTTSAPATEVKETTSSTTPSMAVASANEQSKLNNSSFTCYSRDVGYYADVQLECKVYHFCLPGDFNGEPVYQRISYLCLNDTVFDQQALDCVVRDKMTSPCSESEQHYAESNKILRQAILKQGDKNSTVTSASTTTPAPQA